MGSSDSGEELTNIHFPGRLRHKSAVSSTARRRSRNSRTRPRQPTLLAGDDRPGPLCVANTSPVLPLVHWLSLSRRSLRKKVSRNQDQRIGSDPVCGCELRRPSARRRPSAPGAPAHLFREDSAGGSTQEVEECSKLGNCRSCAGRARSRGCALQRSGPGSSTNATPSFTKVELGYGLTERSHAISSASSSSSPSVTTPLPTMQIGRAHV